MDVSCPRCDTVYEFDAEKVRGGGGVTLKCSQCEHLFRLESPVGILDESQRRWMVRKTDSGDILYFAGFDTLHKWIMEGRIDGKDAISRTGESWKVIQTIGEFTPIFQVVASIARLTAKDESADSSEKSVTPPVKRSASTTTSPTNTAPTTTQSVGKSTANKRSRTAPGRPDHSTIPPDSTAPVARRLTKPAASPEQPASKSPRKPNRATHRTVPGRPGNVSGGHRAQEESPGEAPLRKRQSTIQSTPAPAISRYEGKDRFDESPREDSRPDVELDDDWSLGDLPLPEEDRPSLNEAPVKKRRRWPWLLVAALLLAIGAAIWQQEALEEFIDTSGASVPGAAQIQERATAQPEETSDPVGLARSGISGALEEAGEEVRKTVSPLVSTAVDGARMRVEKAVEAGVVDARRAAQPSASELIRRGRRSLDRGDGHGARRSFQRALEEEPGNAEATVGLGWAYLSLQDVDSAVIRFHAALRQDSSVGEALIGLGRAERVRGDRRAALLAYEQYLQQFPNGSDASIARFQSEQLRQALGD